MASTHCGKVKVVARIKGEREADGFRESAPVSKPWIVVSRPDSNPTLNSSSRVKISFNSDQTTSGKQSYEVDELYEQVVGNEEIFSKEIKPLISGLFDSQNSTIFAFGPRGSGKSHTLQGSEEDPGLAVLTLDSILLRAEEEQKVVNISFYEVSQDRIIDMLDSKRSEVLVFEDAQGKIRLKGLSKVKVKSTAEFQKLYSNAMTTRMQKATEPPNWSHIGCILHVVSPQSENSIARLVGKINFIDLASFEDSRRKSSDGLNLSETTRIKKSLTAVQNVLYALNAKEKRVPYRESKLTRMLQDSLGGNRKVVMVTCMNPFFCQETLQTISMASRSCIAGFLAYLDPGSSGRSANKTAEKFSAQVPKSASKQLVKSSPQVLKSPSRLSVRTNLMSPKVMKPISSSASGRKQGGSLQMSARKARDGMTIQTTGRKLFVETNQAKTPKMEEKKVCPATSSLMRSSTKTEAKFFQEKEVALDHSTQIVEISAVTAHSGTGSSQFPSAKEMSVTKACSDMTSQSPSNEVPTKEVNVSFTNNSSDVISSQLSSDEVPLEEAVIQADPDVSTTPCTLQTPTITSGFLLEGKENKPNDGPSPPLSARLRELSNNLKSLCIPREASLKMTKDSSTLYEQVIHENLEPKTPNFVPSTKAHAKCELSNNASPWTNLSSMKESLAQEYLNFLNTASKEELKSVKGIGEKRATYIIELREESPFKEIDDLRDIGLSKNQIKKMMESVTGNLFS